jgi:hypothetical protein
MITKDNAAQYLPLVQALAEGKTLQMKTGDSWIDAARSLSFTCEPERYRVKPPEPRRFWVNVYDKTKSLQRAGYAYDSRKEADAASNGNRIDCVEVVEVVSG